jgi:hypothetical protein
MALHQFSELQYNYLAFVNFVNEGHFWEDKENRIAFFVSLARNNGIDPLVAAEWYKLSAGKVSSTKVCS